VSKKYNLSFTAYKLYHECPAKYHRKYVLGLRPTKTPAFFIHGSAIDKGCNDLLEGKDLISAARSASEELLRLKEPGVEFDGRDYDPELLDGKTRRFLLDAVRAFGYKGEDVDGLVRTLLSMQANGEILSAGQQAALALAMHASMLEKSIIMLRDFQRKIMPLIKRVVSVQKEVKRGIADIEIELHGFDGVLIADNKTAYKRWEDDCVVTSIQLAGYEAKAGAYFVMNKVIKKNRVKTCQKCGNVSTGRHKTCDADLTMTERPETGRCGGEWAETIEPECDIQVFVDQIPQTQRDLVETAYQETEQAIEAKCFPKNLNSCVVSYGKKKVKCEFYEFCRTGSLEGLTSREDRNK